MTPATTKRAKAPSSVVIWSARIAADRKRANQNQDTELRSITQAVELRSREIGARALILSGSTARSRRTSVSDIDYHVVGNRPDVRDLAGEIDLYSDSPESFMAKLRDGDDFVQWSLRFGCVLFDDGIARTAAEHMLQEDLWPDPERKRRQAARAVPLARSMVDSRDEDAAREQVRIALSLTSRWWLLERGIFPLARDELSEQLVAAGAKNLAAAVNASIHGAPHANQLLSWLHLAGDLLANAPSRRAAAG